MKLFEARDPKDPSKTIQYLAHQDEFRFAQARNSYLGGGWRSGKSYGLIGFSEVSMNCNPGCDGAIVEPDYKMLEDFLENKFKPAFRPYIIGEKKTHFLYRIFMKRGITVLGLSGHNVEKLEQFELSWMGIDEAGLMKKDLFVRANARVNDSNARRQRIGFAGTPKMGWLSEIFEGRDDKQRKSIHINTEANPYLTQEFIQGLYASCPARMRPAYIDGRFIPVGDMVWAEFDSDQHIIPWDFDHDVRIKSGYTQEAPVNIVVDWAPRRPHVLWVQRAPKDTRMPGGWFTERETSVVIDEIYPDGRGRVSGITVKNLCSMIAKRNNQRGYRVREGVMDPAGKAIQDTSGESEKIQAERNLGIPFLARYGERIKVGVQHVQLALEPSMGHPFLFFAKSLENNSDPCMGYGNSEENKNRSVLKAMTGYAYNEEKGGKLPDEPHHDDVFSHAADCVRYHIRYYYPVDRLSADAWSVR